MPVLNFATSDRSLRDGRAALILVGKEFESCKPHSSGRSGENWHWWLIAFRIFRYFEPGQSRIYPDRSRAEYLSIKPGNISQCFEEKPQGAVPISLEQLAYFTYSNYLAGRSAIFSVIFSSTKLNWTKVAVFGAAGLCVPNCLTSVELRVCYHISCKQKTGL